MLVGIVDSRPSWGVERIVENRRVSSADLRTALKALLSLGIPALRRVRDSAGIERFYRSYPQINGRRMGQGLVAKAAKHGDTSEVGRGREKLRCPWLRPLVWHDQTMRRG